jgi:hypothetical protein
MLLFPEPFKPVIALKDESQPAIVVRTGYDLNPARALVCQRTRRREEKQRACRRGRVLRCASCGRAERVDGVRPSESCDAQRGESTREASARLYTFRVERPTVKIGARSRRRGLWGRAGRGARQTGESRTWSRPRRVRLAPQRPKQAPNALPFAPTSLDRPAHIPRSHPTDTLPIAFYKSMAVLDRAIAALDVLGTVVQAVPVVGENLKSAIEIATKTCEMVKVHMLYNHDTQSQQDLQKMKENREGYEQLVDRAARLLAALANVIMKATPEKLKGMEGNVARLLMCVIVPIIFARCFDPTGQHVERDPVDRRCTPRRSDSHKQAPLCKEVHSHQGQRHCASHRGSRSGHEARPATRPRDRGVRRAHLIIQVLMCALMPLTR